MVTRRSIDCVSETHCPVHNMQAQINCEKTTLDNGITIVSERVPSTQSVGLSLLVDAGPADESPDHSGLAHLCEHALFLGTPLRDQKALTRLIDTAGGQLGAFTAPDYTCFYAHVLQDYTSYAIDLLGDILVASSFPEDLLEREREVIVQEIRGYEDMPSAILSQRIKNLLWPNHGISRPVAGSVDSVRSLGRSDVVQFLSRHYTPDRIVVAAAGAVDHASLAEQVEDAFWTLRGHGTARETEQPEPVGGIDVKEANSGQAYFALAIPTESYTNDHRYRLHLISALLGGGLSSRLQVKLRDELGLVYFVHTELLAYRSTGCLLIEGSCSPSALQHVIELILIELTGLAWWASPVDEEELWKTVMQVRGQSQLATDIVSNRVSRIATQQFHFGHRVPDHEILESIDSLTIEDLQQTCLEKLTPAINHVAIAASTPTENVESVCNDLTALRDCFVSINNDSSTL